ncbi:MAG: hypothetical protein UX89_C0002G0012 [Parcubacteria group bacterium GW2011_GWA2_47_16]|nr:MAG: hypothetical protein UX89_C0002G0012 [Parcubacteria group bacterium GW2011_GWA2_47_16]
MELVRVKSKFQITIPVSLRKAAGLKVGDVLDISVKNGTIVLTRLVMTAKRFQK